MGLGVTGCDLLVLVLILGAIIALVIGLSDRRRRARE